MKVCLRGLSSLCCSVVLFLSVTLLSFAQSGTNGTIAVLGSSVAKGHSAGGSIINGSYSLGYAGLLTTYLEPQEWGVTNISVSGDTTTKVLARFDTDVLPADPDQVLIGLSLANEGLNGASNPDAVYESYRSGMTNIIGRLRSNGIYAMAGLCYPHGSYTAAEYEYLKDMNLLINSWDLPSANYLGAVDDGSGHWVEGYYNDVGHPNAAGHEEMFYTIVPSLFDAVRLGKTESPSSISDDERYAVIARDESVQDPIRYTPAETIHSFTTAFKVRSDSIGTVAAVISGETSSSSGTTLGSDKILVDFGPANDDDGRAAPSPDSRGNYWNAWRPADGDAYIDPGVSISDLVTAADGTPTSIGLVVTESFQSNGRNNGGLFSPEFALLADFAVTNATEDYFHKVGTGGFNITGLVAGGSYKLRFFASRQTSETRETRYTVDCASGVFAADLITSGSGIGDGGYDGNNNNIAELDGLLADSNGELSVEVSNIQSIYSYIAIMEISESDLTVEPIDTESLKLSDKLLVDFSPANDDDGRATPSPDSNGNYWNNWRPVDGGVAIPVGTAFRNLRKSDDDTETSLSLEVTTSFNCPNGLVNGGLKNPDPALLGDFAVAYATEDYFYDSGTGGFKITGLDPKFSYKLRFFGTRESTSTRETRYVVETGKGTVSTNLVTSGSSIGSNGYNGNNATTVTLNNLTCDNNGEMVVEIQVIQGGFAYIGIMEITVEALKPLELADRMLVDFGPANDDDGRATASPDINGNIWNNWRPVNGSVPITAGTSFSNLQTADEGLYTSVGLEVTSDFTGSNGRINGGLFAPDSALLGEFAITNATEDYFYDDSDAAFKITGLDKSFAYDLRFFATRESTSARETRYTVTGGNGTFTTNLVTSGTAIGTDGYNGNNDTIVALAGLIPDASGELAIHLHRGASLVYIGVMEINVSGVAPVLTNDAGRILVDLGPEEDGHGHATASPDTNGNYWNSWPTTPNQANVVAGDSLNNLVRTEDGSATYVGMEITTAFKPTGLQNGGLASPDPALLGDFAIATATEDYFYGAGGFKLTGLKQNTLYSMRFFGTRATSDIRETLYTVTAGNGTFATNLVTSGDNIGSDGLYDGNDDTIVGLTGILADEDGEISVKLSIATGAHCHIGIFEIKEEGSISGTGYGTVELRSDSLVYVDSTGNEIIAPVDADNYQWYDVAVSHCYARQQTTLYVDGVAAGTAVEQIAPTSFVLGGQGIAATNRMAGPLLAEYQDWCVYRSSWNADEAAAQAAGDLQQASLEICAALSDLSFTQGEPVENRAQSLSEAVVNSASVEASPSGTLIMLN